MADIDLVPNDYRDWLAKRELLKSASLILLALAVVVVSMGEIFGRKVRSFETAAAEMRAANAITHQQEQELEDLSSREAEYQRHWSLLRGLRAGAAVDDIFAIVDKSLQADELWFVDWEFRRAGVIVDGQQRGIETGYFVIVESDAGEQQEAVFQVETHMSINGQAKDHQALSRFVRALFAQEHIKDVSVKKTSRANFADGTVVDFDITVILNSESQES